MPESRKWKRAGESCMRVIFCAFAHPIIVIVLERNGQIVILLVLPACLISTSAAVLPAAIAASTTEVGRRCAAATTSSSCKFQTFLGDSFVQIGDLGFLNLPEGNILEKNIDLTNEREER